MINGIRTDTQRCLFRLQLQNRRDVDVLENIVTSVLDANKMRTFSQTVPHFGSSKVRGFNPTKFGSLLCTVEIETKAYRTYDGFYFIVFCNVAFAFLNYIVCNC